MVARLYVFIAPSGAGKSTAAREIVEKFSDFVRPVKKTTRELRVDDDDVENTDKVDLRGNSQYVAYLTNGGVTYLIDLKEVRARLKQGISQILIVNNPMTIKILEKILGKKYVRVIFIHRKISRGDMRAICATRGMEDYQISMEVEKRMSIRTVLYHQLASGVLRVDHVLINTSITDCVAQFEMIHTSEVAEDSSNSPLLNIVVAGTGTGKDKLLRLFESIPNGGQFIIPKYLTREIKNDDGCETIHVRKVPEQCLSYEFFRHQYGVDPVTVRERLEKNGLGFITISSVEVARALKDLAKTWGMRVRIVYLHQDSPDFSVYSANDARLRREHSEQLLQLYREELIEEPGLSVILAVNDDILCTYAQSMCMEASNI